jgi:hypothetical protein
MLEASARLRSAPALLHWPFNLTHWARELLRAAWPFTRLDHTPGSAPHRRCRVFKASGSGGGRGGWLRMPAVAPLARAAALRHCGIPEGKAPGSVPERIPEGEAPGSVLERGLPAGTPEGGDASEGEEGRSLLEGGAPGGIPEGEASAGLFRANSTQHATGASFAEGNERAPLPRRLQPTLSPTDAAPSFSPAAQSSPLRAVLLLRESIPGGEPRHFARLNRLLRLMAAALPAHVVSVARTRGDARMCEQASWVAGAGVVLSPHGAHLLNALWMEPSAELLEVGSVTSFSFHPQISSLSYPLSLQAELLEVGLPSLGPLPLSSPLFSSFPHASPPLSFLLDPL